MTDFFVSTSGDDTNPGTSKEKPFRTIAHAISKLKAGDVLNLRGGSYVETLKIKGLHGSPNKAIVIRSFSKEHATIDGCVLQFRSADDKDWEPAQLHDPAAVADEFVSYARFPPDPKNRMNRGAFLDHEPYTRLITHSRLEDLRSENQTFKSRLSLGDPRCGFEVTDKSGNKLGGKNPFVYMGPGLFFNVDRDSPTCGRVHVRLSHTTNNVPGLEDYKGETDPRKLRLAISSEDMTTLAIEDSSFIRFENLSVRFGGDRTLVLRRTEGIVFDHVRILAASYGVKFGRNNTATVFHHCEIRGGVPGWYFRSDRKADYYFIEGDKVVRNLLGTQTSRTLFSGEPENSGIEISHCEFRDAHDVYLFGRDVKFHHNWIDNMNDESLFIDAVETHDLLIYQNVFTRCLSAISYALGAPSGPTRIYRNLFDLRRPTAGKRPTQVGVTEVFFQGHLFKTGGRNPEGPFDLFQNTCLVFRLKANPLFGHYTHIEGAEQRRSLNNIFVAIDPDSANNLPITLLPPIGFPGRTDGNCYFRMSKAKRKLFQVIGGPTFHTLEELQCSPYCAQTGHEAESIAKDPLFRRIGGITSSTIGDDLRLRSESSARGKGIELPDDLRTPDPLAPSRGRPDIGCYQSGKPGLSVGVDSRNQFPLSPDEVSKGATKKRPRRSK